MDKSLFQCVTKYQKLSRRPLPKSFYEQNCTDLTKAVLGKLLVRKIGTKRISGFIVEAESYYGGELDGASHAYKGKRTPRNEPMYMAPGTSYVYITYGMYNCFNISSGGEGCAVLIRALEPYEGIDVMKKNRLMKSKKTTMDLKDLCSGPSKLCMALKMTKDCCNKLDLISSSSLWLEDGVEGFDVVQTTRIGIDSTGPEWAGKPWRYYVLNNPHISVRNKKAESDFKKSLDIGSSSEL